MKKAFIFLTVIMTIMPFISKGQEIEKSRKIFLSAEIGQKYFHEYTVGSRTFKSISEMVSLAPIELSVFLCHDINTKNTLSLGLSIYDAFLQGEKLTPTIIDYRHYFKNEKNSLFANAGIGYTLFGPSDIKSTIIKMGIGYRFTITATKRMNIGVNYDFNKLYDIFVFDDNSSFSSNTKDISVYAFNVKIGIGF